MSNLKDLVLRSRSCRRFFENEPVSREVLMELIDLARLSPSARNAQTIKYIISNTPEKNQLIFPHLAWAGYLKDWDGPEKGERPPAYLMMLSDTRISDNYFCDEGIAAQSILLGATEKGLAGCIVGSIERLKLQKDLKIPKHFKIIQVVALGKPKEKVVIETSKDGDIKYYRDENGIHYVPKRPLDELILEL
ncbi:nitroreductase family protein [Alkalitalea saponilacus]|uniref:Nitroreductase n=1 Tax=Alkalitalea saponilacus TaxID=889453 RepID=A0A1T5BXI4_9BACT|nr:nitroreductase family protein [Alkalitalea saponilacus]ASB49548.1 nitroreductase [Alkalitalea saponilacus]SKB52072.1 Nitroreductase [Alkalitalea saponilacus]